MNQLFDESRSQISFDTMNLVDLIRFSAAGYGAMNLIQKSIPGWDLTKGDGKDISFECIPMAKQFYFRLPTEEPLTVYLKETPKSDLDYECVFKIFRYLNYLDLNADAFLESLPNNWDKNLKTASFHKANALVKSLINKFASYQNSDLAQTSRTLRHTTACEAAESGNIKLLNWFVEKGEFIDKKLLHSVVKNDKSIKLLLPMLNTGQQFKWAIENAVWHSDHVIPWILIVAANRHITIIGLDKDSIVISLRKAVASNDLDMIKYVVETLAANVMINLKDFTSMAGVNDNPVIAKYLMKYSEHTRENL